MALPPGGGQGHSVRGWALLGQANLPQGIPSQTTLGAHANSVRAVQDQSETVSEHVGLSSRELESHVERIDDPNGVELIHGWQGPDFGIDRNQ